MGLMTGSGPLSKRPAGMFNLEPPPPGRGLYLEPTPKRVRVEVGGETVADSRHAMLLHESGWRRTREIVIHPRDPYHRIDVLKTDRQAASRSTASSRSGRDALV